MSEIPAAPRPQGRVDDPSLHPTVAGAAGEPPNDEAGMLSDIVAHASTLKLGAGPLLHGLSDKEQPPTDIDAILWTPAVDFVIQHPQQPLPPLGPIKTTIIPYCSSTPLTQSSLNVAGVRVSAPAQISHAALSPITTSCINQELLLLWDARLGGQATPLLHLIRSVDAFHSTLLEEPDHYIRRSSGILSHAQQLLDWNIATTESDYAVYMKAFTVGKNDGGSRFILDATPLNRVSVSAPYMGLPRLHVLFQELMDYDFAATVDAMSYFYQFELHKDIRPYFSFIANSTRGYGLRLCLERLCMGWRFSPAIAQQCSNTICAEVLSRLPFKAMCVAWVDNFIMAASTAMELTTLIATFKQVAEEINLTLHPFSTAPQSLSVLGFDVDLKLRSITHQQKWLTKLRAQMKATTWTLRSTVELTGKIMWIAYARQLALCKLPSTLHTLSLVASTVAEHRNWDAPFEISAAAFTEFQDVVTLAHQPFSPTCDVEDDLWLLMYSDASSSSWAWTSGAYSTCDRFVAWSDAHIFFHELRAALHALLSAAARGVKQVALGVDNTAVLFALRGQHSTSVIANEWIRRAMEQIPPSFRFRIFHVATELNPADQYTRGARARIGPMRYITSGKGQWPTMSERASLSSATDCSE